MNTISPYVMPGIRNLGNIHPSVEDVIERIRIAVKKVSKFSWQAIISNSRKRELVTARFLFCYVVRDTFPKYPLIRIGEKIGGRDHTTVLNAINTFSDFLSSGDEETIMLRNAVVQIANIPAKVAYIPIKRRQGLKPALKCERPISEYSNKSW